MNYNFIAFCAALAVMFICMAYSETHQPADPLTCDNQITNALVDAGVLPEEQREIH